MAKVYIFDVALSFYEPKVIRRIAIRGDQTLHHLHLAIVEAFERDDDHLYSFYVGVGTGTTRRRLEAATEYVHPMSEMGEVAASEVTIDDLNLIRSTKIEYLFDYGDSWWHKIKLVKTEEVTDRRMRFPKILEKTGEAPPQYPDIDE